MEGRQSMYFFNRIYVQKRFCSVIRRLNLCNKESVPRNNVLQDRAS